MNATAILDQLMKEAQGARAGSTGATSGSGAAGGGTLSRLISGLTSQLRGRQASGTGGNIDLSALLGSGALSLLVGTKRGRSLGGKALKYGALASVGMLAWNAWQNRHSGQQQAGPDGQGEQIDRLQGQAREQRSLEILQAMIMAARADGHIDEAERTRLAQHLDGLGADPELHRWVEQQLQAPLDAEALARQADSPQAAREIYLVSAALVDEQNAMERAWLDELARHLNIDRELAQELERQALKASA